MTGKYTRHCLSPPKWGMIDAMATIILALGSNLGDRSENLARARALLSQTLTITAASPIYETAPWGVIEQPDFLNQALVAETDMPPDALLTLAKDIEARMGRDFGTIRYGPRVIDIDIIGYGDIILTSALLTIPHSRLPERAFVLVPLNDIAPEWVHPGLGQTVAEMLAQVDASGVIRWAPAISQLPSHTSPDERL